MARTYKLYFGYVNLLRKTFVRNGRSTKREIRWVVNRFEKIDSAGYRRPYQHARSSRNCENIATVTERVPQDLNRSTNTL